MLGVVAACYGKLDERVAMTSAPGYNEDVLRRYFNGLIGSASKREIMDDNPIMSQRTIERVLQRLQPRATSRKREAARATRYRKAQ